MRPYTKDEQEQLEELKRKARTSAFQGATSLFFGSGLKKLPPLWDQIFIQTYTSAFLDEIKKIEKQRQEINEK